LFSLKDGETAFDISKNKNRNDIIVLLYAHSSKLRSHHPVNKLKDFTHIQSVASLQHVQNVQCTPKKGNFGLILCSLKQFFSKNTLALIDILFLHTQKFYPNDATVFNDKAFKLYFIFLLKAIQKSRPKFQSGPRK
jgi:hypothetical protein